MSYFMTVSGSIAAISLKDAELIPAREAQSYIASLEGKLESLDGTPVFLVHDKETGTSDLLVSDLKDALLEGTNPNSVPLMAILNSCFKAGISFRIWLANNDMNALVSNSEEVSDLVTTLEALRLRCGAWWHAR
jgi:hypothetical protein